MGATTSRGRRCAQLLLLLLATVQVGAWPRRQQKNSPAEDSAIVEQAAPEATGLIGLLATALFEFLDRPKYRFYLWATFGVSLDERSTVAGVTLLCNFLYVVIVLSLVLVVPRAHWLVGTAATFFVGPAVVLAILGCIVGSLVVFALYPMTSVAAVWLACFLQSRLFQQIGLRLELDVDHDGDVDSMDIVKALAKTRLGRRLKLDAIHQFLNTVQAKTTQARLETIESKIDDIKHHVASTAGGASTDPTTKAATGLW